MPLDKEILQKARNNLHSENKVILSLEQKGFCVSLLKDGHTEEREGRDVTDFLESINTASVSWVDYSVDDLANDAAKVAASLGFSEHLVNSLVKLHRSGYEDNDSEMGIMFPAILVSGFDVSVRYLIVLMKNGLVVTIHDQKVQRFFRLRRYAKIFMKKLKPSLSLTDKLTLVLIRIIDENNTRNFDHLREIEANSDKLSEKLADVKTPRQEMSTSIHLMKHALITYLNGMWEMLDVLNALRYGDPELLTDDPKLLQRINGLVAEVNMQISLAEHMSDVLASGLEVIQSIYNNQLQILNNKLALLVAYLTVLGTAVMVPNTLATALGSSAFDLGPEDQGWYVALLIGSTILATIASYLWVKSAGLLPDRTE